MLVEVSTRRYRVPRRRKHHSPKPSIAPDVAPAMSELRGFSFLFAAIMLVPIVCSCPAQSTFLRRCTGAAFFSSA